MKEKLESIASKLGSYEYLRHDKKDYNQYVTFAADNKEFYRVYDDKISYKIGDDDIILWTDGLCKISAKDEIGTYTIDDNGNIICNFNGKEEIYNHNMSYTGDSDNNHFQIYKNNIEGITNDGHTTYSRINHIEYDEEAYEELIQSIINVGNDIQTDIANACSNISSICSNIRPEPISCNTDGITNAVANKVNELNNINTAINATLLAYDACDRELLSDINEYLVESLFDANNSNLANNFKSIFLSNDEGKYNIEYKHATDVLKFSADTDFNKVSKDIENIIEKDKRMYEKAESILLLYGGNRNIEKKDINYIKNELYSLENVKGGRVLAGIEYLTAHKINPSNAHNVDFNGQEKDDINYDFNSALINNYITSSRTEIVHFDESSRYGELPSYFLLGRTNEKCPIHYGRVYPKDITNVEKLAYDIIIDDIFDIVRQLPDGVKSRLAANTTKVVNPSNNKIREAFTNNVIVFTADKDSQNTKSDKGYYVKAELGNNASGTIVINVQDILMNADKGYKYLEDATYSLIARKMIDVVKLSNNFNLNYNHYDSIKKEYTDMQKLDKDYEDAMVSLLKDLSEDNKRKVASKYGSGMMYDITALFGPRTTSVCKVVVDDQ